jgi:chemotaxis protein methyltransferase CheR
MTAASVSEVHAHPVETALEPPAWSLLASRVAQWTGLAFAPARWRELERGVARAAEAAGVAEPSVYLSHLLSQTPDAATLSLLAQHLTVGETYFFRDPQCMQALSAHVLPQLAAATPRALRLWSAGCCTGEEAYTLAILLQRERQPGATILGTDINPAFVARAREGVYGDWSFRGDPLRLRGRWLTRTDGGWRVADALRSRVRFEVDSLCAPAPSPLDVDPPLDLIVCRNVLMYLSPTAFARTIERFRRRLAPGGWLLVSPGEASDALYPGFEPEVIDGVRFYRRAVDDPPDPGPLAGPPIRVGSADPASLYGEAPAPTVVASDALTMPVQAPVPASVTALPNPTPPIATPSTTTPRRTPSRDARARALADQGRLADALACCDDWVAAEPLSAAARYVQALVLIEQNGTARAAEALRQALYLDNGFVMAWLALARLARAEGDELQSSRHVEAARRLLEPLPAEMPIPEADGLTARQVLELVAAWKAAPSASAQSSAPAAGPGGAR